MCLKSCSFAGLAAWLISLAGAVLLAVALNLAVDPIFSHPPLPQASSTVMASASPPAPVPAPASEPTPPVQPQASAPDPAPAPPAAADPQETGRRIFNQCKVCHSLEPGKNQAGPSLAGVVGRPRASQQGFRYSDAMAASREAWSEAALDRYLADPKTAIPGNKMAFKGLAAAEDRKAVIDFMKSGGKP